MWSDDPEDKPATPEGGMPKVDSVTSFILNCTRRHHFNKKFWLSQLDKVIRKS